MTIEERIDKVLAEQFPNCPRMQRDYARRVLISALGLEHELVRQQPVPVPVLDEHGEPVMCDHHVRPHPRSTFEWVDRQRWVTPWEDAGPRATSEEMQARLDARMAEVAERMGLS